jgi:hypothetical protein
MSSVGMNRIAGLGAGLPLLIFLMVICIPESSAFPDAFAASVRADQPVSLGDTITAKHPCMDTERVRMWGALRVLTETRVDEGFGGALSAQVQLMIPSDGFRIVAVSDSYEYQVAGDANARLNLRGPFPAVGTAQGDLKVIDPRGEDFTANLFFDVRVDTGGGTLVTFNRVELEC